MSELGTVLYIGGFELPDKNAAAQRVVGIAKSLRDMGYHVRFVNALKECKAPATNKEYFGFSTFEYKRERKSDYLFTGKTVVSIIKNIKPNIIIAYNYPALALNRVRKYCQSNGIKCIADVTEWYRASEGTTIYKLVKTLDSNFRMRYVHTHMDALIVISRFLHDYYKPYVPVALIPPTVDIEDKKWKVAVTKSVDKTSFVYAGTPSVNKERLDLVVEAIESCAKTENIILNIVGITRQQFVNMYSWKSPISKAIKFFGRISHEESLNIIKESSWSIIIRENNSVVKAGFPTKLVESISCGTPVIANNFSDVFEYINSHTGITISSFNEIECVIKKACKKNIYVNNSSFDYHNYLNEIIDLLQRMR